MKIKFKNRSMIKTILNNNSIRSPSSDNSLITELDMASKFYDDDSCRTYMCGKCKTIFHVEYFKHKIGNEPEKEILQPILFKHCHNCGIEFRNYYNVR